MNFDALILAGGQSSRMGRDKAWLELDGRPLLARQLDLVRTLGAAEVFISGRSGADYSTLGCRVLTDAFPDAGPLAGIERGLAEATAPLLLVLAVDLPRMEADFLRRLMAGCTERCGAVPELRGRLEPLVAFYPKGAHAKAVAQLQGGCRAVHAFAVAGEAADWMLRIPVVVADEPSFLNWNAPADLAGGNSRPEAPSSP